MYTFLDIFAFFNIEQFLYISQVICCWLAYDMHRLLIKFLLISRKNTPKAAAMTGTMQLLAGVKLCTGRPITNHPHYEDKMLRLRTREVKCQVFIWDLLLEQ